MVQVHVPLYILLYSGAHVFYWITCLWSLYEFVDGFGRELVDSGMVIGLQNLFFTTEIAFPVGWRTEETTMR